MIDILMEGVAGIADFQAKQLLGKRYKRLQIYFEKENKIKLDDVSKIDEMDELAKDFELSETVEWIYKNWRK